MALVLLLFAFGLLGYLIARSQTRGPVDDLAVGAAPEGLTDQIRGLGGWFGSQLGFEKKPADLRQWAAEALDLPGDVRAWIMNLSADEALAFGQALEQHAGAMGLDLRTFFSRTAGQTPEQRDAYIEAVAVYSRAYRKAKEAQEQETAEQESAEQEAGETEGKPDGQTEPAEGEVIEGKLVAEKRLSRRRRGGAAEETAASA
jgi:hypothetical protein